MLLIKRIYVEDSYYKLTVKAAEIVKCMKAGIPCFVIDSSDAENNIMMYGLMTLASYTDAVDGAGIEYTVNSDGYYVSGGE